MALAKSTELAKVVVAVRQRRQHGGVRSKLRDDEKENGEGREKVDA